MATLAEKMAARKKAKQANDVQMETTESDVQRSTPPPRTAESSASLLRQQMDAANVDQTVRYIDIDLIDVEEQVRTTFDEDYIQDLAVDFVLNETHPYQPKFPVSVYQRENGRYLLDTGENRYRAVKYGRDNRSAMGLDDVMAFTQIRATVLGPEPPKIKRIQSQDKENILRDDLSYVELGKALQLFFAENPDASQSQAAEWCGFINANSGRVKVNQALKLMKLDQDIIEKVASDAIAINTAFAEQEQRTQQQAIESLVDTQVPEPQPTVKTTTPKKKNQQQGTISMPMDQGINMIKLINWIAEKEQLGNQIALPKKPTRKDIIDALKSDVLVQLLDRIE